MKTRNLLLTIVFCILSCCGYAQLSSDRYILVFFTEGVTRETRTINGDTLQAAKFEDEHLRHTLNAAGISDSLIEVALPEFSKGDTLTILADGQRLYQPDMTRLFRIKVPEDRDRQEIIELLTRLPEVLYAEPDDIAVPQVIPDDEYFDDQWGLRNTTNPGRDIHATAAWDIYTGNANNIIAIIDGGVEATHPDLAGKISGGSTGFGWDGHGTYVAGIAAARTNNVTGIAGVDWHARIHPQRVDGATIAQIYQRIVNAVNFSSNVHVLNHSYVLADTYHNPSPFSATLRLAFAYAYKANRVSVASMGNYQHTHPGETYYPAGFDNVISVGATNISDQIWFGSLHGNHIDVSAPGVGIISTINGDYALGTGTSAAAPHVSGIASLLKGSRPTLSNDDIANIIRLSADKVNSMYGQNFTPAYGFGRVNAGRALEMLQLPYELKQWTSFGGTVVGSTNNFSSQIYGVPGLSEGNYIVRRHEVHKTVAFPQPFCQVTGAWGRGVSTSGWSLANPMFGEGFCEIVSGTLTNTGATLRTYVYEIWTVLGQYLGYYPTTPSNVNFAYSVLGTLNPDSISGPSIVCNTNTTFSLGNLPPGSSVTWTRSNNLTYVSGQGTANYTVKATGPATSGEGWVEASITGECGTLVLKKDVWVGIPKKPSHIVFVPHTPCTNQFVLAYFNEINPPLSQVYYQWSGGDHVFFPQGESSTWFQTKGPLSYTTNVHVSAQNICGNNILTQLLTVQECGGGGIPPVPPKSVPETPLLAISPNPASDYIDVSINNVSQQLQGNEVYVMTIYDRFSQPVRNVTTDVPHVRIPVYNLPTGVYVLSVVSSDQVRLHGKFIFQR